MIVSAARVLAPDGVLEPGWVEVRGTTVHAVGAGAPPAPADRHGDGWLVPGFVDVHVHGGAGGDFTRGRAEDVAAAVGHHRAHGTTTLLAGVVTGPADAMARAVAALAEHVADGTIAGIHLEGPFLSAAHRGAHRPDLLREPEPGAVRRLLDAGRGAVRMVTLAPELAGGLDAVRQVVDAGAVAAVGHTAADHETTLAAVDAGARVATHLWNGMPGPHHRRPGPVTALLERDEVVVELIVDGHHLHPATVRAAHRQAGPRRVALVTDAIAASGLPDGRYELGGSAVVVRAGTATLAGGNRSLAGSTLTLDRAVRGAVAAGVDAVAALRAATEVPAGAVGLADRAGALRPGRRADAVLLDADLHVTAVLHGGRWTTPDPTGSTS